MFFYIAIGTTFGMMLICSLWQYSILNMKWLGLKDDPRPCPLLEVIENPESIFDNMVKNNNSVINIDNLLKAEGNLIAAAPSKTKERRKTKTRSQPSLSAHNRRKRLTFGVLKRISKEDREIVFPKSKLSTVDMHRIVQSFGRKQIINECTVDIDNQAIKVKQNMDLSLLENCNSDAIVNQTPFIDQIESMSKNIDMGLTVHQSYSGKNITIQNRGGSNLSTPRSSLISNAVESNYSASKDILVNTPLVVETVDDLDVNEVVELKPQVGMIREIVSPRKTSIQVLADTKESFSLNRIESKKKDDLEQEISQTIVNDGTGNAMMDMPSPDDSEIIVYEYEDNYDGQILDHNLEVIEIEQNETELPIVTNNHPDELIIEEPDVVLPTSQVETENTSTSADATSPDAVMDFDNYVNTEDINGSTNTNNTEDINGSTTVPTVAIEQELLEEDTVKNNEFPMPSQTVSDQILSQPSLQVDIPNLTRPDTSMLPELPSPIIPVVDELPISSKLASTIIHGDKSDNLPTNTEDKISEPTTADISHDALQSNSPLTNFTTNSPTAITDVEPSAPTTTVTTTKSPAPIITLPPVITHRQTSYPLHFLSSLSNASANSNTTNVTSTTATPALSAPTITTSPQPLSPLPKLPPLSSIASPTLSTPLFTVRNPPSTTTAAAPPTSSSLLSSFNPQGLALQRKRSTRKESVVWSRQRLHARGRDREEAERSEKRRDSNHPNHSNRDDGSSIGSSIASVARRSIINTNASNGVSNISTARNSIISTNISGMSNVSAARNSVISNIANSRTSFRGNASVGSNSSPNSTASSNVPPIERRRTSVRRQSRRSSSMHREDEREYKNIGDSILEEDEEDDWDDDDYDSEYSRDYSSSEEEYAEGNDHSDDDYSSRDSRSHEDSDYSNESDY
jgi:hypothetical protein